MFLKLISSTPTHLEEEKKRHHKEQVPRLRIDQGINFWIYISECFFLCPVSGGMETAGVFTPWTLIGSCIPYTLCLLVDASLKQYWDLHLATEWHGDPNDFPQGHTETFDWSYLEQLLWVQCSNDVAIMA